MEESAPNTTNHLSLSQPSAAATTTTTTTKSLPKRFIRSQIPDSILHDVALNDAISVLPSNYNFEIHKCVWRARSINAKCVALQFPEGLLMYSLVISDILQSFTSVTHCFVLGDVTFGACCVDDLSAAALSADLLIHFGHSCLVPIDFTAIPCLYIFVEIFIDVKKFFEQIKLNFVRESEKFSFILAGTIQFSNAIRAVKPELESLGFKVLVPQSKPLSAGEVLGCTAPSVSIGELSKNGEIEEVIIFVADGRFHLEAFMIANPGVKTFRYDPYLGTLFLEEYDHVGMKEERRRAIEKAKGAKNWGIVLGTLGRQGNPRILDRLEEKMSGKGLDWTVVLMSEISPTRIALFEDSIDAWIQIACPRLSIDWGDAFVKPLLTPFEAEIALGDLQGWWERKKTKVKNVDLSCCNNGVDCSQNRSCCCKCSNGEKEEEKGAFKVDYPMDYYAQDGGQWNSCYSKKPNRNQRKSVHT